VPGAADIVDWLTREGIPFRFLTNTSSRPRGSIAEKLSGMGVPASEDDILTPAVAAMAWLRKESPGRPALFVPAATASEFSDLDPLPVDAEEGAGAVVVGDLGEAWDFATFNRAFRLLMAEPRPTLIALGLTRYWRADDGLRLDAGAFVRALEYAAGTTAVVTGKPDRAFYQAAVGGLGLDADDVVMVGDDIRSDVEGAQRAGLTGVLVRTGKFTPADTDGDVTPDAILDSIADLPDWWGAAQVRLASEG
jgi:HAD superfamily hydrolase (TIGR01458 family)